MKKKGVISVIVPIYGVEKYLEECIESILGQTYTKLEIILIDDASPDRCGEICDRYAQMDDRIIVIHQKNGGAAAARNAGLRIATGEYIGFVDSDDYLEPDAYEKLLEALVANDADIVHGQFRYVYVNGKVVHEGSEEIVSFSAAQYLTQFTTDWTCALSPVKLFRHHVLTDVYYEEGHCIDDEFFTYRGVMKAEKIVYIPTIVYNYRQRASSVMKNRDTIEKKCDDMLDYLGKRCHHVSESFPELKSLFESHYVDYLLWLATTDMATKKTISEIKKRLITHVAGGKVQFWKKGQRKRAQRILSFLVKPVRIEQHGKDGVTHSGYQFYK